VAEANGVDVTSSIAELEERARQVGVREGGKCIHVGSNLTQAQTQ